MAEEAKSLWIVTNGSYSDYRVICAAPTQELAMEIRDRLGADGFDELPLLTAAEDYLRVVSYSADAYVDRDGQVKAYGSDWREIGVPPRPWVRADGFGGIAVRIHAATPDKALHAVKEYATELAAELAAGVPVEDVVLAFNTRSESSGFLPGGDT